MASVVSKAAAAATSAVSAAATTTVASASTTSASSPIIQKARRLAGPHKLPHLLAILPLSGLQSIIRPVNAPANTLYLVTRTKLKFSAVEPEEAEAEEKAKVAGAKVGEIEKVKATREEKNLKASNPVDGGIVKAHGKAWGMFFRNGRYIAPKVKSKSAIGLIRPAKTSWVAIDPQTLPTSTLDAIKNYKEAAEKHMEKKKQLLEERATFWDAKKVVARVERSEMMKRLAKKRIDDQKVQILY